ncbi:discoidin domain-containing protein [Dactylosporangium sucinum]|uniref:F5/8 type C domain-containing protein n=1 Tax=Dactylosporangium sucinum TaxID=1424081 RepID=A0A917T081_9ACTN|nr:discoidin domain-containing protein [Dactylosporangium sucinum]GGM03568.1 hypothetical protein GCM10007977_001140 [Dactylosporangium sucinum]
MSTNLSKHRAWRAGKAGNRVIGGLIVAGVLLAVGGAFGMDDPKTPATSTGLEPGTTDPANLAAPSGPDLSEVVPLVPSDAAPGESPQPGASPNGGPSTPAKPNPTAAPATTVPTSTAPATTAPPATGNLALHRPAQASSTIRSAHAALYATDGSADTYWEGANHGLPQTLTVDLGTAARMGRVVLRLPPASGWPSRTQTIAVLAGLDGSTFSTVTGPAQYTFDAANGNVVTLTLPAPTARYLRLSFTANSQWDAGQVSEVEVYAA